MIQEGADYEIYCAKMLRSKFNEVYLWKDIPKSYLLELNLITCIDESLNDIGCDIVGVSSDKQFHFIQCKNYTTSGKENTIKIDDLAGFSYFIANNLYKNAYVYYSGKLSSNVIKGAKNIQFVKLPFIINKYVDNNNVALTPRYYQIDAYNALKDQSRGVLSLPCGCGKTFTPSHI